MPDSRTREGHTDEGEQEEPARCSAASRSSRRSSSRAAPAGDSGSDGDASAGSTLTVWVDAERVDALKGAAEAYTEKTGVEVELVGKDNANIKDDFIQQVPTGQGPDITMGAHDWLGELSTNGVVAPIELGDTAADYLPVAIHASTYEGTVYMLPYAVENIAVLRNADLIPEAATSFDDMIAKGQAAGLPRPFVVEQGVEGNPYHLYPFQTAFGAPVFGTDAEGYDPDRPADRQRGRRAVRHVARQPGQERHRRLQHRHRRRHRQGRVPRRHGGLLADRPVERRRGGRRRHQRRDRHRSQPDRRGRRSRSPVSRASSSASESENKVAANDFLVNYIGTEDVQLALFEAGNILPALTAAAEAASSDPIIAGFAAVGAEAVPMPAIPAMGAVWQYWGVAEADDHQRRRPRPRRGRSSRPTCRPRSASSRPATTPGRMPLRHPPRSTHVSTRRAKQD